MLITNEIRWFYPGNIPKQITLWFEQNCLIKPSPPEERTDVYLYSPGCDFLGIKLRQGRLEVKWRQAELGVVRFGELIEGNAEKWGKWLCEDSTEESFQKATVLTKPSWISVHKVRYAQLYQVLPDLSAQRVPADEGIKNACSVELTQLAIADNYWWSLALEARGDDVRLMDNLQVTGRLIFNTVAFVEFLRENSYPYPKWLQLATDT
jgi:hypothetical protein